MASLRYTLPVVLALLLCGWALAQSPGPPSNLTAVDVPADDGNALTVGFNKSADDGGGAADVTEYRVYWRLASSAAAPALGTTVSATGAASYSKALGGLPAGQWISVFVAAYDGTSESTRIGKTVQVVDNTVPRPPLNPRAADVAADNGRAVTFTFDASLDDTATDREVTAYAVYRSDSAAVAGIFRTALYPQAASYTYTDTLIAAGRTYYYTARAVGRTGASTLTAPVAVTAVDNTAPGPPTLTLTDLAFDNGDKMLLTIGRSADDGQGARDVLRYTVYVQPSGSAPHQVAVLTASGSPTYRYVATGLAKNTSYTFAVKASDATHDSTLVSVNQAPLDTVAPRPPGRVIATDPPNDNGDTMQLTIIRSLDDGVAGDVRSYLIYRAPSGGTFTQIATITATGAYSYGHLATGLTKNAWYSFGVVASDGDNVSSRVGVTVQPRDTRPPAAPTNLVALAPASGGTALPVTFGRSADDAVGGDMTSYRMFRRPAGTTTWTQVGSVTAIRAASYAYTFTGLTPARYDFGVGAYDGANASATIYIAVDTNTLGVPQNVALTDVPNDEGVALNLSFGRSADDGTGQDDVTRYFIYKAVGAGALNKIAEVGAANALTYNYLAAGLTLGMTYTMGVSAFDGILESAIVTRTATPLDNTPPRPPTGLAVTDWPSDDGTSLQVAFNASPDDTTADPEVTRYDVYRAATAVGAATKVGAVTATRVALYSYRDTGLTAGLTYWYYLIAVAGTGSSPATARVSGVPRDNRAPRAPTGLTAADRPYDAGGIVDLGWNRSADDGTGLDSVVSYFVYRKMANVVQDPVRIGTIPATNAASYTWADTTVPMDLILYEYTLTAANASGVEFTPAGPARAAAANNNVVVFNPPTNFTVADVAGDTGGQLLLTWTRSTSEGDIGPPPPPPISASPAEITPQAGYGGSYEFYRRTASGTYTTLPTFSVSADGTNNPMTTVNNGLTNGIRYYYKARYRRYNQISNFTAEVSAIPVSNRSAASPAAAAPSAEATTPAAANGLSVQLVDAPQSLTVGQDQTLTVAVSGQGASSVCLEYSVNGAAASRTAAVSGRDSYRAEVRLNTAYLSPRATLTVRAVAATATATAVSDVATMTTASP